MLRYCMYDTNAELPCELVPYVLTSRYIQQRIKEEKMKKKEYTIFEVVSRFRVY